MSGHSKWSGIKHKKAIVDAKRGQIFTKVARELTVSARDGGPDPAMNFRLRLTIQKAKEVNMPADNIERAIARGIGGKDGVQLEEIRYEGYGPNGVAILVDVLTDNRNRTVAALRNIFTRAGGALGETNSVGYLFTKQGVIRVPVGDGDVEEMAVEILDAIDVGADGDVREDGDTVEIITSPNDVERVRASLEAQGYAIDSADVSMQPSTSVPLDEKQAAQVLRFLEALEDNDDVQDVYANPDISDEVLESIGAASE